MPRTTLDLDPSVLDELKLRGHREGKSIGRLASELLAGVLAKPVSVPTRPDFAWFTADLGRPLVDLEDKDAVNAALDDRG